MDKFKLKKLNFPNYNFNFKINDNKPYIFDVVRKKFIVLTPEEWVRQNVVKYLIEKDVSLIKHILKLLYLNTYIYVMINFSKK